MSDTDRGATYSKRLEKRFHKTVQACDPHDGGVWDVLIASDKIAWAGQNGWGHAHDLAFLVPWSLLNIKQMYRGVRDDEREIDEDSWLCYVAAPSFAHDHKRKVKVAAWPNQVFLVFVNAQRVAFNWYWCKCDAYDPDAPLDCDSRFKEKVF